MILLFYEKSPIQGVILAIILRIELIRSAILHVGRKKQASQGNRNQSNNDTQQNRFNHVLCSSCATGKSSDTNVLYVSLS